MELIFIAALCSVAVSILLKVCSNTGFIPLQMIAWNYAAASVLCFFWFKPDIVHLSFTHTPWLLIVALGGLLPSVFLFLAKSLQTAGILKTEIAQRLSVILSLSAAYFIFNEQFNHYKWLGIVCGILAIVLILFSQRSSTQLTKDQGILYLILVWIGYACIDILLKYTTGLGLQFTVALNLVFVAAFILALSYIKLTCGHFGQRKNIVAGLGLGVINFANIALYVKAHLLLKDTPAIVFATMNLLVVIFGVMSGLLFFKERLKVSAAIGLILGIFSVACLAYAMTA
ncbi:MULTISPECIES: DMT family transporter [unclassified Acinetobacter]|uniref:DMT family transporter n=1 Tax=unclassified Acinetobacter TaxID=196816 RepID=UPI0029347100|nr:MULTISPECIES: DMT family transporter [unclassified Acinetobacter]WOE32345.1 DMT family transporter [Acinetobacter sp. SAAs470]WOE37818.1 DMT family transporter [Acinetobacter sp. SAAs474]